MENGNDLRRDAKVILIDSCRDTVIVLSLSYCVHTNMLVCNVQEHVQWSVWIIVLYYHSNQQYAKLKINNYFKLTYICGFV